MKVALSGTITFSLIYFIGGTVLSLERDFILLLPIILPILFSFSFSNRFINLKSFVIGFCCAVAASIKPHAIIVFPLLFVFNLFFNYEENFSILKTKRILKPLFYSFLGLSLPVLLTLIYLWISGSFNTFWEIQTNFTALYRNSKMLLVHDPTMPINDYIFNKIIKLQGYRPFLLPAICGFYISIFRSSLNRLQKLLIYLFFALSILFFLYVLIAGKFLYYHWVPFVYCLICLGSTCFIQQKESTSKFKALFELLPLIIIFSIISIQLLRTPNRQYFVHELTDTPTGNDDLYPLYPDIYKTADYLKENLRPGDKVLPIDDIGLAIHSMYLARAELATYYPVEALFAFGEAEFPNSIYFQQIHKDYMNRFNTAKPRFVIDFSSEKRYVDLEQILDSDYVAIKLERGTIYQRKDRK
jgi:hypothetical protein